MAGLTDEGDDGIVDGLGEGGGDGLEVGFEGLQDGGLEVFHGDCGKACILLLSRRLSISETEIGKKI